MGRLGLSLVIGVLLRGEVDGGGNATVIVVSSTTSDLDRTWLFRRS